LEFGLEFATADEIGSKDIVSLSGESLFCTHESEKRLKIIFFISSNFTFQNVKITTFVNTFEMRIFESPPPPRQPEQRK